MNIDSETAPIENRVPLLAAAALGIWWMLLSWPGIIDGDIWFHIASGRYTLQHRWPPLTDPFSYPSQDNAYICLHWLFQLAAYAFYRFFGAHGLVVLKAALLTGLGVSVAGALRTRKSDGSLLLLFAVLAGCTGALTLRPQLLSLIYLCAMLFVWRRGGAPWWFPVILLLWVNSHGLFILGLFTAGCWAVEDLKKRWLWLLLCGAAVFANPYGIDGVLFPFTLFTRIGGENVYSLNIREFASPLRHHLFVGQIAGLACIVLLLAGTAAFIARGRSLPRARLLALGGQFAGFAFVYLLAYRNMAPFAVVAGWTVAVLLPEIGRYQLPNGRLRLAFAGTVVLLLFVYHVRPRTGGYPGAFSAPYAEKGWGGLATWSVPDAAVAYLKEKQWRGRMFNDFNWGGYLLFELSPTVPVFIDPRLEVHSYEHFADYVRLTKDPAHFFKLDDRYDFDLAIFCHFPFLGLPGLFRLLDEHPEWELVYTDPMAAIFCRKDRACNVALIGDKRLSACDSNGFAERRTAYLNAAPAGSRLLHPPDRTELYRLTGLGQTCVYRRELRAGLCRLFDAARLAPEIGNLHFLIAAAALELGDQELFSKSLQLLWIQQPNHPELPKLLELRNAAKP